MPVVGEKVYKKVELVTEGAWVDILTNPGTDVWQSIKEEPDEEKAGSIMLSQLIRAWNFTNADGTDAEVTPDMVQKALSSFDVVKIYSVLGVDKLFMSDAKKKSSTPISSEEKVDLRPQTTSSSNTENTSI